MGRAVSTAYFALFHLLVSEATSTIVPIRPASLADVVRRRFDHRSMKELCVKVATGNLPSFPSAVRQVFANPLESELPDVAQAFVDLQISRYQSDYAPHLPVAVAQVTALVQQASDAFSCWRSVKSIDNANAFCVALLLHKTWRVD